MQRHFNFIILMLGTIHTICGQNPNMEIGGFEYSIIPDLGDTSVEKYTLNLNLGKRFKKRGTFGVGVSYNYYDFMFNNASLDFDAHSYENIHTIRARFFFKYFINTTWSANVMFAPIVSSNFEGGLSHEDVIISSAVTLSKSWSNEKTSSLFTFGIGYGIALGEPQLIPIVSFRKKVNETWSYFLGIPRTKLNYHFDQRHTLSTEASLNGLFSNISSSINFQELGSFTDTKLQYNSLDTSLNYVYQIQPNWTTVVKIGYSPWNQLKILDNENNEIYDFEPDSSLFISIGLKFNLNK